MEGPRADLGWLDFEGNQAFSDEELAQTLDLSGHLDFDLLEERLEALRQRYRNTGYPLAVAERGRLQVQETLERSYFPLPFQQVSKLSVPLEIKVEEGQRFRFGSLQRPHELRDLGLPEPVEGEYYSERRLLEYRRQVGTHFASQGRLHWEASCASSCPPSSPPPEWWPPGIPCAWRDVLTQTASGLSRLSDPRTSLRLAFDRSSSRGCAFR